MAWENQESEKIEFPLGLLKRTVAELERPHLPSRVRHILPSSVGKFKQSNTRSHQRQRPYIGGEVLTTPLQTHSDSGFPYLPETYHFWTTTRMRNHC